MSLNFFDNESLSVRDFENIHLKELQSGDFAKHSVFFMIFENDLFVHENRMNFLTGFNASIGSVCVEIRSYDSDRNKIVTGDKFLFVDDRYFDEASEFVKTLEVQKEQKDGIPLIDDEFAEFSKIIESSKSSKISKVSKITVLKNEKEWIKEFNEKNGILCFDKNLIRCDELMHLRSEFFGIQCRFLNRNLLNEKWINGCELFSGQSASESVCRLESAQNKCLDYASSYIGTIMFISNEDAGESSESKIERVIKKNLKRDLNCEKKKNSQHINNNNQKNKQNCQNVIQNIKNSVDKSHTAHLIIDSSSIAWLLNKRKIDQNPGINGVLLISESETVLLDDLKSLKNHLERPAKTSEKLAEKKSENNLKGALENCSKKLSEKYNKILVDVKGACVSIVDLLVDMNIQVVHKIDPCVLAKSIKKEAEIRNIKEIHRYDGAAVVTFMYWMENVVLQNQREISLKEKDLKKESLDNFTYSFKTVSEIDAARKLHEIKSQNEKFLCESFETIISFDEKSFMIHKKPKHDQIKNFYLLDSGGQYAYGTTDMTRTVAVLSDFEDLSKKKYHYTLVLKGHIAIASARFKNGISGAHLDILARQYLWENGLDYLHSTGHGVGYLLNVHEGPQAIGFRNNIALKPGMILSNEPGFYLKNEYGIRIENLVRVKESCYEGYLEFETISFAPFCSKLIDRSMLNLKEIDWIKNYYASVLENLNGLLSKNENNWLKREMSDFL